MEKFSTKWRDLTIPLGFLSILFLGLSILARDFTVFGIFIASMAGLFVFGFLVNLVVIVLCSPILWVSSKLIERRQKKQNRGRKKSQGGLW